MAYLFGERYRVGSQPTDRCLVRDADQLELLVRSLDDSLRNLSETR